MNKTIVQKMKAEGKWAGPVDDSVIRQMEKTLRVCLPEEYRAFISEFGCGNFCGLEIYGLGVKPVGVPSFEWLLNTFRRDGISVPSCAVPFMPLDDGNWAAIVCDRFGHFQEGDIVALSLVDGATYRIGDLLSKSFWEFLASEVGE